jgi:hypothetical protein
MREGVTCAKWAVALRRSCLLPFAALASCVLPQPENLEIREPDMGSEENVDAAVKKSDARKADAVADTRQVAADAEPAADGGTVDAAAVDAPQAPNVEGTNCQDFAVLYCWKDRQCQPYLSDLLYGPEVSCQQRVKLLCDLTFSPSKVPDSGWTPTAFKDCVSKWPSATCEDWVSAGRYLTGAGCRVAGMRATGAPCATDAQCRTGYCRRPELAPCGECAELGLVGSACSDPADCAVGLLCSLDKKCQLAGTEGEACDEARLCDWSLICAKGKCSALHRVGETCDPDLGDCDFPRESAVCSTSGVCERYRIPSLNEPCPMMLCRGDLQCRNGFCNATISEGDTCTGNEMGCTFPASCEGGICKLPVVEECTRADAGAPKG